MTHRYYILSSAAIWPYNMTIYRSSKCFHLNFFLFTYLNCLPGLLDSYRTNRSSVLRWSTLLFENAFVWGFFCTVIVQKVYIKVDVFPKICRNAILLAVLIHLYPKNTFEILLCFFWCQVNKLVFQKMHLLLGKKASHTISLCTG